MSWTPVTLSGLSPLSPKLLLLNRKLIAPAQGYREQGLPALGDGSPEAE